MIRNMDIENQPRQHGKTTWLRKELAEALIRNDYDSYIIIVNHENMRRDWEHYLSENLKLDVRTSPHSSLIRVETPNSFRNKFFLNGQEALFLVDEYDNMEPHMQEEIIRFLSLCTTKCDVIARGTLKEKRYRLFKDFLQ